MTTETGLPSLARAYLDRLAAEARRLPPDQAQDLLADIGEHLAAGLGAEPTEADVRNLLDRLGTPAEVVAAAAPAVTVGPPAASAARAGIGGVEVGSVVALFAAELAMPILGVGAAIVGSIVPFGILALFLGVIWLCGVVLMAFSGVWTYREKLRGFLALGTGLPVVAVLLAGAVVPASTTSCTASETGIQTCTSSGAPSWLGLVLLALALVYFAYQVVTARALLKSRG